MSALNAQTTGGWDLARLGELLDRQEALFLRLKAMSQRQGRVLREDQTDALLRVLVERQAIVDDLDAASRELAPFRASWDRVLASAPRERRERYLAQVERMTQIAADIAGRDEEDRREIEGRRDELARDLAGVGRQRGAAAAYGAKEARPRPRFQDTEG